MIDYDVLMVSTEAQTEIVVASDDNVLLVDVYLQTELSMPLESFEIVEVARQGPTGPPGITGAVGPTLFTDISAAALSDITARLDGLDQFTASFSDPSNTANFSTVYQLSN